jgi:transcriptional regulator with GAF, ATPase, and Fis domain
MNLLIYLPDRRSYTFPLNNPVTRIGRAADNDLVLTDLQVSRYHAEILVLEKGIFIEDKESRHGTVVNGDRIGEAVCLEDQSVILVGNTRLILQTKTLPKAPDDEALSKLTTWRFPLDQTLQRDPQHLVEVADKASTPPAGVESRPVQATKDHDKKTLPVLAGHLMALFETGKLLLQPTSLDVLQDAFLGQIFIALKADRASLLLRDPGAAAWVSRATRVREGLGKQFEGRIPLSRTILDRMLEQREAVLIEDTALEKALVEKRSIFEQQIRSALCAPLWDGQSIRGVLYVDRCGLSDRFQVEDLWFLCAMATLGAMAFERVEFMERLQAAERRLQEENLHLHCEVERQHRFDRIIGSSPAMQKVFKLVECILPTDTTVLIEGESGTGKELIARAIHHNGPRRERRFEAINCAAFPDQLLESELFGHKKGAFTGAIADKPGLFQLADKGTLFLDEIAETSPAMQAKLLRVLQEGMFRPLGGTEDRRVTVRVIAATNKQLSEEVKVGRFREDLFFRLHVFPIHIPPLRERMEDMPLLFQHFLAQHAARQGKRIERIHADVMTVLKSFPFPGNVRELENLIERAVALVPDGAMIGVEHLPEAVVANAKSVFSVPPVSGTLREAVSRVERQMILQALDAHKGNLTRVAETLGLSRQGLRDKMRILGIYRATITSEES